MKEFWLAVKESISQARSCSRCQGVFLAVVVLVLSASTLDAQAVKEIMLAGMGIASVLVTHGSATQTMNKAATAAAAAHPAPPVDPNASGNRTL